MSRRFDRFIDDLSRVALSEPAQPNVIRATSERRPWAYHAAGRAGSGRACNQYARNVPENAVRRCNLRLYLEQLGDIGPRLMLVGEAVSHRGGRLTGIPFVSESLMLCGAGPVLGEHRGYRRATATPRPSTEASATMVWATIRHIEPLPLLWNAFPFHPHLPGNPHSNRMPTAAELAIGAPFIERLLRLFPIERVVAIGNQAAASLSRLGIEHVKVRHPSQGGKRKFVEGMARL